MVLGYHGDCFIMIEIGPVYTTDPEYNWNNENPGIRRYWNMIGGGMGIPFLGGNNFRPKDDCTDFEEVIIPENPGGTGTTITTAPIVYKDGIFNIGGQDCFESRYSPCLAGTNPSFDPCACDAIDDNTEFEYRVGDIVCCPEGTAGYAAGVKWILQAQSTTAPPYNCGQQIFSYDAFCVNYVEGSTPTDGCWTPCTEMVAMLPSITSQNILRKETLSLIVNDPEDPCNPTAVTGGETPSGEGENRGNGEPQEEPGLCNCVTNNTTILDLGMTQISWGDIPVAVMNFRMGNSNPDYGDTDLANSAYHGPNKSNCYQANMSLCCLTDYFRVHAHMFVKGSTNGNGYVETRTFEMTGIDDNTIVQIYFIQGSVDSVASPQNDKLFLHIPTSDFDNQITTGMYGTPGSFVNAAQLAGAAGWSTNVNQITLQIPQNQQNSGTIGPYILERLFNDVNNGSSTYLTKGGVTWDTSSSPTEDDGYWEMAPPAVSDGAISNYAVGTSINNNSITKILSDGNGGPFISTNATQDWRTYSFNIEVQLDCQGSTPNSIEIIPNVPAYTLGTTISTSSSVPVTQPCPVNPAARALPRLGTVQPESVSMSTLQASGGAVQITVQDIVNQTGQNLPASNYEIIQSKIYIIENTPNFNTSNEIEYNNPMIATPDGVNTFTPSYKTFIDNKGNEVTQLNWLQQKADNLGDGKLMLSFVDEPQRDSFERNLKTKQIGNVETTTISFPSTEKN